MVDLPSSVERVVVDFHSTDSLAKAFFQKHAVVEAFDPSVAVHQERVLKAAVDAGVQHIITPDFSSNTFNTHIDELMLFEPKRKAQAVLESFCKNSPLHWTAIITSPWFDWGFST